MKKLFPLALVAALAAFPLFAEDQEDTVDTLDLLEPEVSEKDDKPAIWPAFFAIGELPATPDLVGVRITVPFSTRQENVTGLDLGFWGRSVYFEGFQLNILRNDARDYCSGVQAGFYNSVGRGNGVGVQFGLWNEASSMVGVQGGLVNLVGEAQGFQIGLINRAESLYGAQIGIINIIRDSDLPFFPVINIGF